MEKKDIKILAIESSCDETSAAVVVMVGKYYQISYIRRLTFTHCMAALFLR